MAIVGLGTDIVEIARIEQSLTRSPALLKRVLTESEQVIFATMADKHPANAARYFAKRFAAKEAAAKALGTGIGRGVSFQHIHISNNADGAPLLSLSDYAAELAATMAVSHIWLSITDEQAYAAATVILERQ
ncbi:holo-ACP synthase [Rheinheimera baltica]|uniref:Holo-[acyl-carrier-protein] synthase n=1 Tax=Rheinheimera baltica TaxID=67576 RepID=A0ABT9HVV0_9GAMM|nr:holo-ACP synthase [Rheinheimera baltica]MDP5135253.1 holo-ACP synthase [Rheinheimera baltica]MDP5143990.1 holo-ACP synthase [Rheinheimera baltica]MDP5188931.1 holo-ACP synthase [Rheinheimera baltica]